MKWQGRLSFKQFNRNKRARFGIKFYETCDSKSGYIYNLKIYVGKDNNNSCKQSPLGISGQVVIDLLGDLGGQGRTLYVDNWYSSPWLFNRLHNEKTNVCGTVRIKRTYLPKINHKEIKKGEMKFFSSKKMTYIAWKDKKLVTILSTMHSPQIIGTNKRDYFTKKLIQKPNIVLSYNNNMGGVDLSDQCITPYEIMRKSMKWYIKIFFHLLDLAIFNAFVVYNTLRPTRKLKFLCFRRKLARELLEQHGRKEPKRSRKSFVHANPMRFSAPHFPAAIGASKSVRKRCALCYKKGKKQQWTSIMCEDCSNIPLCVIPCFKIYHTTKL